MASLPKDAGDARCSVHPDRPAEIACARCGDFACTECRGYLSCAACASVDDEAGFVPIARSRVVRATLGPALLAAPALVFSGWTVATWSPHGVGSGVPAIVALVLLLAAVALYLGARYRMGGSVAAARRAEREHQALEAGVADRTPTPDRLVTLAPSLRAAPRAHARLLLSIARAHRDAGAPHHARAILDRVGASGWLGPQTADLRASLPR